MDKEKEKNASRKQILALIDVARKELRAIAPEAELCEKGIRLNNIKQLLIKAMAQLDAATHNEETVHSITKPYRKKIRQQRKELKLLNRHIRLMKDGGKYTLAKLLEAKKETTDAFNDTGEKVWNSKKSMQQYIEQERIDEHEGN